MRISEIISEAFSLENTMSAVAADIGNNVTNTFDDLKKSASAWLGTHDDLRGWGFISGGIETRSWWDKVWSPLSNPKKGGKTVTGLQGELYDLSKQAGRSGRILSNLLSDMITDRGNFMRLSRRLPPILVAIGEAHGHDLLVSRAKKWSRDLSEFEKWLADVEAYRPKTQEKSAAKAPASVPDAKKSAQPSLVPGQNAAAEKIVNDVLRMLPSGIAGDIRQAIAKSSNKIKALQDELAKRGLQV